jgi:geranylgeranylglycerol-phosphate geranylgeranyltransferase
MKEYLEILRPGNAIMAVIAVLLMGIIFKKFNLELFNLKLILATICVFLATGGGNVINDVFDYKIDLINKPNRPIPSGRISLNNGKIYAIILFLISIFLAILISLIISSYLPLIIVLINIILMYFYAKRLKASILIGNLTVAYLTGSCFVFGGIITGKIEISIILGFFAFLMTLAREIVKDMEDKKGDEEEKIKTFPIAYGVKASAILASIFIIIDCILSSTLYIFKIFNDYSLIPLIIALILFIYSSIKILLNQSMKNSKKVSKLLKIGMLITFISFAIGSFPF